MDANSKVLLTFKIPTRFLLLSSAACVDWIVKTMNQWVMMKNACIVRIQQNLQPGFGEEPASFYA